MLFHRPAVHGLYVLCYLSRQQPDSVVSAAKAAESMDVPPEQAAKVLQALQSAGLVTATRGRSGGYRLARGLAEISVLEVMDALAASDEESALKSRSCPVNSLECTAYRGMVRLKDEVRNLLGSTTLEALLGEPCCDEVKPILTVADADAETQPSGVQ